MKHICHISVLNPLLHSRIFYRLALGAKSLGYQVSIIAQGEEVTEKEGIHLYPTGNFHRLSPRRFFLSRLIRKQALALKADMYVLHSPELLGLGEWLKKKTGAKLIYDVHEDYSLNLLHAPHYPPVLRKILANWVRRRELQALAYLDAVSYAEACYQGLLPFPSDATFVLRNSFTPSQTSASPQLEIPHEAYMLYTGTLAWAWGLQESFHLWKAINRIQDLKWIIAGFDARGEVIQSIQQQAREAGLEDQLGVIGGTSYVPYADILALIKACWFGTAFYHLQPNIVGKVPTKFFEYMAMKRPLLFPTEKNWVSLNKKSPFGISLSENEWEDPEKLEAILQQLQEWKPPQLPIKAYAFEAEIPILKSMLEGLYH